MIIKGHVVKEFVLMTLKEYESTPISFLNRFYKDGWEVLDIDKEFGCVVMAR